MSEPAPEQRPSTGILPSQELRALILEGAVAGPDLDEKQIQPASLDLRLGPVAYRVRASFLPGRAASVRERVETLGMHEIDLRKGAVLEKGCVYIVPLLESLRLGKRLSGMANPKSSAGRLDVFCRVITDGGGEFDRIREGYKGPLYAEISPRGFSLVVRQGSRLVQLRLRRGSPVLGERALKKLHEEEGLVEGGQANAIAGDSVVLGVSLMPDGADGVVGYRARRDTDTVDVDKVDFYDPFDYWEAVRVRAGTGLILSPDDFYILSSKEAVNVPPDHAAEMVAYDTLVGEFRVHYAGFFDPGFGHAGTGGAGSRAVLEVRSHEVPFLIEHGQAVGRLQYERLTALPDKLYGVGIGSSYQRQGLQLGKQFKRIS